MKGLRVGMGDGIKQRKRKQTIGVIVILVPHPYSFDPFRKSLASSVDSLLSLHTYSDFLR